MRSPLSRLKREPEQSVVFLIKGSVFKCLIRVSAPWPGVSHTSPGPEREADMSEHPFLMRNSLNCGTQRIVPVRTYS